MLLGGSVDYMTNFIASRTPIGTNDDPAQDHIDRIKERCSSEVALWMIGHRGDIMQHINNTTTTFLEFWTKPPVTALFPNLAIMASHMSFMISHEGAVGIIR